MSDISKIKLPDGSEFNIKDAAVPSWAKAASKPSYTAEEVGAATTSYVDNAISQAGSGLPEVTNDDIGKALKVVQDIGDDIIPQQSITIQAGASSAVIQNYDITKFVAGTPVRLTLSNEEHDFTVSFDAIISNNNDVTFYSEQDIEQEDPVATISYENNQLIFDQLRQTEELLELNIHLQTLEPQWQPDRINELPNPEIIPPLDETGWQWSNLGKSPIVNDSNIYNLINQSISLQSSDFVYNSDYGLYSVNVATDSENKFKPGNILTVGLVSQGEINQFDSQCIIAEATPGYPYNYYSYFYNVSIGVTSQGQIDLFVHSEPTNIISIENVNIIEPKWELQSSPIVFNFVEDTFNHIAEFDPLFYNTQTDIVTLSKQFRYFMHSSYPVQIHLRTQDSDGDTTNYILNKLPTLIGLNDPDFSTIITHADTNRIGTIRFRPNVRLDDGEYISIGTVNYYNYQLLPNNANNGDIMRYDSSSSSWQTTPAPTVPTNVSSFTNDAGYLTLATLPIYDGSVI